MSTIRSEGKDSRDFQNCLLYRGCLLSGVPLYSLPALFAEKAPDEKLKMNKLGP